MGVRGCAAASLEGWCQVCKGLPGTQLWEAAYRMWRGGGEKESCLSWKN